MASPAKYPLLLRLVAAAVNVSNKSAKILRDVKKSGELNILEKAANDYVTRADFLSQLNIIKSLEKMFPKLKFCGEEGELNNKYEDELVDTYDQKVLSEAQYLPEIYNTIKEEDLYVWIDPLDATKEFTQGADVSKECTVLIGISWNGKPIAGVINQPFYPYLNYSSDFGRHLWGIVGLGAYDSVHGKLSKPAANNYNKKILTTRSHMNDLIRNDLSKIPNHSILQVGGSGYKILCVIEGVGDAYIYPSRGCKRWDTCAPEALLNALGGQLTDIYGNKYTYGNPKTYEEVENLYGIIASLNEPASAYTNYISPELKTHIKNEANKAILKNNNNFI